MGTIGLSIGVIFGVAASQLGAGSLVVVNVVLFAAIVASLLVAASQRPTGRWSRLGAGSTLVMAGVLFGVLRGLSVCPPAGSAERGQGSAWREVTVETAATPGARCRVRASGEELVLPSEDRCDHPRGRRLLIRSRTWSAGPDYPGDRGGAVEVDAALPRPSDVSRWAQWVAEARTHAWEVTRGDPPMGLSAAVAFGLPGALPPEDRDHLRRAGLGHLLAVSGVHVGLLALWVQFIAARWFAFFPGGRVLATAAGWVPMVMYVVLTGAAPSAIRAATMTGLIGLSGLVGRPHHPVVVLAAVAASMIAWRPQWLTDVGFQLSFVAMMALLPASTGRARGALEATWRITWFLAPLTWWHFGQVAWVGLLANPIALPVFGLWTLPSALIGWGLEPTLGSVALEPARWGAVLLLDLARAVAVAPSVDRTTLQIVAALAGVWSSVQAVRARPRRWRPPALVVAALLAVSLAPPNSSSAGVVESGWVAVHGRSGDGVVSHHRGRACIAGAEVMSASRWTALMDHIGARTAGLSSAEHGPRAEALRAELTRRGRGAPACAVQIDRRRTDPCARMATTYARGRVGRLDPDECFVAGAWRLLGSGPRGRP